MPRTARRVQPGAAYHLASRFLDREYRLVDEDDRLLYLGSLAQAVSRSDSDFLSFALMSTHVHHGLLAGTRSLASLIHPLHTRFALAWHRRHGGLGPVFAARPSTWRVTPNGVARMVAYHHRNPVDAGVVRTPDASRWTSHRFYLRLEPPPLWLNVELGLELCGFADTSTGRRQFDEFVREITFDESPWLPESKQDFESVALSLSSQHVVGIQELLLDFTRESKVRREDVTARRRPLHAARVAFVKYALSRGASRREIARVLNVGPSAIGKLALG